MLDMDNPGGSLGKDLAYQAIPVLFFLNMEIFPK